MATSKEWVKQWVNESQRATDGTFIPRGEESLGDSKSVRFPLSDQNWLDDERKRLGVSFAEMVRICVAEYKKLQKSQNTHHNSKAN